ncbi:MAG: DUF4199 domain-containing protein [Bacteroidota bacterium]
MEDQTQKATIGKLGIRYGLLIGGIYVVLSIVFRIVNPLMAFTNIWVQLFSAVVVIALLVIFGIEIRKNIGGFWSFGTAFKSLMTMSVFIILITILYSFILFKFIDPDMPTKINDASEAVMTERLAKMGMDQDKIDEVAKTFQNGEFKAKLEPTLKNEATAVGFSLVFYAIVNLIVAACIKKNKPVTIDDAIDPTV